MVLNRRGEEDAALSAEEWQTRERDFFTNLQTNQDRIFIRVCRMFRSKSL